MISFIILSILLDLGLSAPMFKADWKNTTYKAVCNTTVMAYSGVEKSLTKEGVSKICSCQPSTNRSDGMFYNTCVKKSKTYQRGHRWGNYKISDVKFCDTIQFAKCDKGLMFDNSQCTGDTCSQTRCRCSRTCSDRYYKNDYTTSSLICRRCDCSSFGRRRLIKKDPLSSPQWVNNQEKSWVCSQGSTRSSVFKAENFDCTDLLNKKVLYCGSGTSNYNGYRYETRTQIVNPSCTYINFLSTPQKCKKLCNADSNDLRGEFGSRYEISSQPSWYFRRMYYNFATSSSSWAREFKNLMPRIFGHGIFCENHIAKYWQFDCRDNKWVSENYNYTISYVACKTNYCNRLTKDQIYRFCRPNPKLKKFLQLLLQKPRYSPIRGTDSSGDATVRFGKPFWHMDIPLSRKMEKCDITKRLSQYDKACVYYKEQLKQMNADCEIRKMHSSGYDYSDTFEKARAKVFKTDYITSGRNVTLTKFNEWVKYYAKRHNCPILPFKCDPDYRVVVEGLVWWGPRATGPPEEMSNASIKSLWKILVFFGLFILLQ